MSTKSNRTLLVLLVTLLLIVQPESGALSAGQAETLTPNVADHDIRQIVFPVAGTSDYADTFGACRDGCSRSHQGVDIFAAKLTPVVAAADGTVVAERRNATGKPGNKIVIEDAEGWRYSYFHLNNDSPGSDDDSNPQSWIIANDLRAGDAVAAGQLVGYVGDSGNAETTEPHLHFEIKPPGRSPINPTPSVTAARGRGQLVAAADIVASEAKKAEWVQLVEDWYLDVAGRHPRDAELAAWSNRFAMGAGTEADLVGDLAMAAPFREPEGVALRGYVAAFSRLPTEGVLDVLADLYRGGGSVEDLADRIVGSVDYGSTGSKADRDEIAALASSADVAIDTWHVFQVVRAYRASQGELPDGEELDAWTQHLELGGLMVDVVAGALDGSLPDGRPRHAGVFGADDLGYEPGETVRQGPIELDPASDQAPGGDGREILGDAEVAFELFVEEDSDGADTANLTVHIPLDQLTAAQAGDAELTVELKLTQADNPDEQAEAEATVELAIADGDRTSQPAPRTQPTVRTPTTRTATTRAPTTRAPTTRRPTTRAPTTAAPTTAPPITPSASTTAAPTTAPPTTTSASTAPTATAPSATTTVVGTETTECSTTTTTATTSTNTPATASTDPNSSGSNSSGSNSSTSDSQASVGGDGTGGETVGSPSSADCPSTTSDSVQADTEPSTTATATTAP